MKKNIIIVGCFVALFLFLGATPYIMYQYNTYPQTTNRYSLGSAGYRWQNGYINNLYTTGISGINRWINQQIWQGDTIQVKYFMLAYNSTPAYYWRNLIKEGSFTYLQDNSGTKFWMKNDSLYSSGNFKYVYQNRLLQMSTGCSIDTVTLGQNVDTTKTTMSIVIRDSTAIQAAAYSRIGLIGWINVSSFKVAGYAGEPASKYMITVFETP